MIYIRLIARYSSHIALAMAVFSSLNSLAQSTENSLLPSFEVISVRQVKGHQESFAGGAGVAWVGVPSKPCKYSTENVRCQLPISELIEEAYQIKDIQLDGGKWIANEVYSVQATTPPNTDRDTARLMLQEMLVERFGMRFHHETREVPVYALIIAKNGPKLQLAEQDPARRNGKVIEGPMGKRLSALSASAGNFEAAAITLDLFAQNMSLFTDLDAPIVNMTGLTGEYKIDLHWQPRESHDHRLTWKDPIFQYIVQEELGLKLEKRKATCQMLVIDHMDRTPTDN